MAWTAPSTAVTGTVLTAATWNAQVRDNMLWLGGGNWASYTPTWSGTIGNGTIAAAYVRVGDWVSYRAKVTWGTTTSHAGAAQTLTLPTTPVAAYAVFAPMGQWDATDAGVNTWLGHVKSEAVSGTGISFVSGISITTPAVCGQVSNTVPMTWGNGDYLQAAGSYQSA